MLWFSFKGEMSTDYDVVVNHITPAYKPNKRVNKLTIPGKDGTLTITDDSYDDMILEIEVTILDVYTTDDVKEWLSGSGDLVSSWNPDYKYRNASMVGVPVEYWDADLFNIKAEFVCSPFMYESDPLIHTLEASGTIINPGSRFSLPVIEVTGTGELTVNGTVLTISETGVTINSEIEECYNGTVNKNNKVSGGFPRLDPGENTVTLGAGITKAVIQGNYRWF